MDKKTKKTAKEAILDELKGERRQLDVTEKAVYRTVWGDRHGPVGTNKMT